MYIGVFDIVQYDCPVVWLTDHVKDASILVVGANVSEIRLGYERIYVVILGNADAVNTSIKKLDFVHGVRKSEIIQRKKRYVKLSMLIDKTKTMEATISYDAFPLTIWIAFDGSERWTLGFHTLKHLREFINKVSEYDYIERYKVIEVPDHALALDYINILSLLSDSITKRITDKQIKLLSAAMKLGYYDWPRRVNVSVLSGKLGISRVAVAKMIRRAERNIISMFLEMVESLPEKR